MKKSHSGQEKWGTSRESKCNNFSSFNVKGIMDISPRIISSLSNYLSTALNLDLWFANIFLYIKASKCKSLEYNQFKIIEILKFSLHSMFIEAG